MEKFIPFKRLRKVSPNPKAFLRLHRGEFGHNFDNKKINKKIWILKIWILKMLKQN